MSRSDSSLWQFGGRFNFHEAAEVDAIVQAARWLTLASGEGHQGADH